MIAGLPRTNCWSLAEHAGEAGPRGMQRFLSSASWDEDKVLNDIRDWTLAHLGDDQAILSSTGPPGAANTKRVPASATTPDELPLVNDHEVSGLEGVSERS
jgi:hypothetical protein